MVGIEWYQLVRQARSFKGVMGFEEYDYPRRLLFGGFLRRVVRTWDLPTSDVNLWISTRFSPASGVHGILEGVFEDEKSGERWLFDVGFFPDSETLRRVKKESGTSLPPVKVSRVLVDGVPVREFNGRIYPDEVILELVKEMDFLYPCGSLQFSLGFKQGGDEYGRNLTLHLYSGEEERHRIVKFVGLGDDFFEVLPAVDSLLFMEAGVSARS